MFLANYNKISKENLGNYSQEKTLKISDDVSIFIIIDSNEKRLWDIILNKSVDYILDNITDSKNIYDSFSVVLDFLNWFLKSLTMKNERIQDLNISIWILEWNKFHFSKIWNSSIYLVKEDEISEVTQNNPNEKNHLEFSYISSWALKSDDLIIMSNDKLLNYLTKSDFLESFNIESLEETWNNLESILNNENLQRNIVLVSFMYKFFEEKSKQNEFIEKMKHFWFRLLDNNYTKKTFARALVLKDKFNISDKVFKNIVFISWLTVSVFLLYLVIWSVVSQTNISMTLTNSKQSLIQARDYLRIANENMANPDLFDINIKKAEKIALEIKNKQLFLNDVDKIIDDISTAKKQFDWLESFESTASNLIYRTEEKWFVKILELNNKKYILNSDFLLWPIVSGQKPVKYAFDKLEDDSFIDWKILWDKLILLTKNTKIVSFDKNKEFKFVNVLGQDKWESSNIIETFWTNIYLVDKDKNQILKHKVAINWYSIWQWFLEDADLKNIWKIASIAIDWWVYILKNDLSLVKLFTSPQYKIESIVLNKLPKNYKTLNPTNSTIITKDNLNYIYMLINNTIFVFEPSSKRYQDVKSLTYLWEIEWEKYPILSININHDWEINILNETWLYKLWFDVSDWKLMLK